MENNKLEKVIIAFRRLRNLGEESPTMALGHGQIAGTAEAGDDPPIRKRRKKYMSGGRGSRKFWLDYLSNYNGRRS
jgi:hypothetical protein